MNVHEVVAAALAEDVGPDGDITSALLPPDARCRAVLAARQAGVLAGRPWAAETFRQVDATIAVDWQAGDGDPLGAGRAFATVAGPLASVLTAERTALNFLCHLSGIATLTRRYVDAASPATIRDTRKTTPGLRLAEKAAVRAGGGENHRRTLSESFLVKDNHLGGLAIGEAVTRARVQRPGTAVEVECDRLEQVEQALAAEADMVLLDNMSPDQVREAVSLVDGRLTVEVSGGVSLGNVGDYAKAGAQLISVGALTHSAPILDIGLDLLSAP